MSAGRSGHAASRVGIDVGPLRPDPSGVGVYVAELAAAMEAIAPERVLRIGERRQPSQSASRLRDGLRYHLGWILTEADAEARASACALAHYTNAVAPPRASVPFVVSIHDLSVLRLPRHHPYRRLVTAPFVLLASRRARRVIVPSLATADEVRRLLRVPHARIDVVPLAARRMRLSADGETVLDRLGLRAGGYILALGTVEPRKNYITLLGAFERIDRRQDFRLVIVGDRGWRNGAFWRALDRSPARDRVIIAGRQPDGSIAALLRHCAVLAYPSLYEGFGLPILEAMAAGVPVVTSDRSSMPEVAGGAAVLVDPLDERSIAAGIVEALDRREELAAAGVDRAGRRTWLDVARDTLTVYDRALADA
ncbi:MAG TPA: glycosyltransferase family 1 protein [Candidatus Limnocylindria bacterium]|nr:glycosyltransferase family 1 protein [Candidatus Limnocylindria bacterium]